MVQEKNQKRLLPSRDIVVSIVSIAIVSIALCCTIFELLDVILTLKYRLMTTQDHCKCHHFKAWYGFLFAFHINYGSILHHFWDKANKQHATQIVDGKYSKCVYELTITKFNRKSNLLFQVDRCRGCVLKATSIVMTSPSAEYPIIAEIYNEAADTVAYVRKIGLIWHDCRWLRLYSAAIVDCLPHSPAILHVPMYTDDNWAEQTDRQSRLWRFTTDFRWSESLLNFRSHVTHRVSDRLKSRPSVGCDLRRSETLWVT